jgi:hypothetical protein
MQRKKIIIIILLISLVVAGSIGIRYWFSSSNNEIITLSQDEDEIKRKPTDPGGLVIPNSDSLVYETIKGGDHVKRKENLLQEPEDPIKLSRRQEESAMMLDSIDEILDNIEYYENEYISVEKLPPTESIDYVVPNILQAKIEDKLDDNNIYVPETSLNIIRALEGSRKISDRQIVFDEEAGYKIQLSSSYSQNDAKNQWQKIQQKHIEILRDANLITKKVDGKNERIFFLVMAGTYPSLSHAKLVCKKLSKRRQNCIVTK